MGNIPDVRLSVLEHQYINSNLSICARSTCRFRSRAIAGADPSVAIFLQTAGRRGTRTCKCTAALAPAGLQDGGSVEGAHKLLIGKASAVMLTKSLNLVNLQAHGNK